VRVIHRRNIKNGNHGHPIYSFIRSRREHNLNLTRAPPIEFPVLTSQEHVFLN
jgi:hypothetical protein